MKRYFTLIMLVLAFCGNVLAWEPVIKETHWFGMHEYYDSPIPAAPIDCYFVNTDLTKTNGWSESGTNGWEATSSANGWTVTKSNSANIYFCQIGKNDSGTPGGVDSRYKLTVANSYENPSSRDVYPTNDGNRHNSDTRCIVFSARWGNGSCSLTQTTTKKLLKGTYKLTYDVQNANSQNTDPNHTYQNLFSVTVDGNVFKDTDTGWISGGDWNTHSIQFTVDGNQEVTISLGYGTSANGPSQMHTPVLFVSNLYLETVSAESDPRITWSGDYIESISVVKDWTGQRPLQQPRTSYYEWLDHSKLRFSVENKAAWGLSIDNSDDHYAYDGLGLCNTSGDYTTFYIHNLKAGDKFNLEYYRYDSRLNPGVPSPQLVSGSVKEIETGSNLLGTAYYTVNSDGDICINIPSKAIIRAVRIEHKNYKKATTEVRELTTEEQNVYGGFGYHYEMKSAGVLEDKRGAVPYITMKFGADNDMTFVRDLGNGKFGASSIIDETNDFNPATAKMQNAYREKSTDYMKNWLAGKEWTIFTANPSSDPNGKFDAQAVVNGETVETNDWPLYGDWFNTIYPLYGSYFYFFPEVHGKLVVEFYCEGAEESAPIWYKKAENGLYPISSDISKPYYQPWTTNGAITKEGTNADGRTVEGHTYKYILDVEKGGVYYLCSLPTNINHEHPIVRLMSYSFIPTFRVAPLYKVVNNTSDIDDSSSNNEIKKVAEIFGGPYSGMNTDDLGAGNATYTRNAEPELKVKCLGNVASAKAKIYEENGHQYLGFSDIDFKSGTNANGEVYNRGGAIVAHLDCEYGEASFVLTIAYDAANAKWGTADGKAARVASTTGGEEVKHWDFFSGKGDSKIDGLWDLGKYGEMSESDKTLYETNPSTWKSKSKLFKEVNKADGLKADWEYTYVDLEKKEEPIFKSVYDMEGDNADMIHETAGLVFLTKSNLAGIYNENASSTTGQFNDRYIGLMGPSDLPLKNDVTGEEHPRALIIPLLHAGDRVVIKMGTYGNTDSNIETKTATLKISGAYDATGQKEITGDYIIGGSGVEDGNGVDVSITDKSQPWGEYHFIATGGENGAAKDFTLEVKEADLLKIYSIVIYRNAKDNNSDILSENELLGDENHLQILNTQDFSTAVDNVQLHMHYRGLNEGTNYGLATAKTGNIKNSDINFSSMTSNTLWYTCSVGGYVDNTTGAPSFTPDKAKFGVIKVRLGVQTINSGTKYVTDYADRMIPVGYRETLEYPYTWDFTDLKKYVSSGIDENGTETAVTDTDLRIWNEWNMRVKPDEWDGSIFASGGQLYAGTTMIDETRGIGITHTNNNVAKITSEVKDENDTKENGGISIGEDTYGFIIPQLAKGQAIYVRAAKVGNTQNATFHVSDGNQAYNFDANSQNEKAFTDTDETYSTYTTTADGDEIFAVAMPGNLADDARLDVRLSFQGYEVKKIAVSTDSKAVNSKGWTSESRDHAIDASLLPYFTGKEMKTYVVSDPNYTDRTLTLTDVGAEAKCVIPAGTGCLIYNTDNGAFNPFGTDNKGFHLFVPDMHDQTGKEYVFDDEYPNLLVANVSDEGKKLEMFDDNNTNYFLTYKYQKIDKNGNPISDEVIESDEMFYRVSAKGIKLHKNSAYLQLPTDEVKPSEKNPSGLSKFTFFFAEPSETTAIETIKSLFGEETTGKPAAWYNLNGQKLNGKPTQGGLYIVNGKKVLVK